MEDKQIVDLYWNREEVATSEMARKYGSYCEMIVNNILRDKDEEKACVDACYQMLWDTIPPHRPQKLKPYLCKIARTHALNQNFDNENKQSIIAELKECILDAATAEEAVYDELKVEIAFQDFLKRLESEQRKVFLARYWWFASISEIASLYKVSENKVEKTLLALRQKFQVVLEQEEILLYAMTEVDDKYLDEMVLTEADEETAIASKKKWRTGAIAAIASVAVMALIAIVVPKGVAEQPQVGTQTENSETNDSESENSSTVIVPDNMQVDVSNLVYVDGVGYLTQETLEAWKDYLPWKEDDEIAALPIYKNLAYYSPAGETVYLDGGTLLTMVQAIAEQLNTKVTMITSYGVDGNDISKDDIYTISATTDIGKIVINGCGQVYIYFSEPIRLLDGYVVPGNTQIVEANTVVSLYLARFSELISANVFKSAAYMIYDPEGNPLLQYRAIEDAYGVEGLLGYYFNPVNFYFDDTKNLIVFQYGDLRSTAELLGYYPIITLEKAKQLLYQGDFSLFGEDDWNKVALPTKDDIRFVELMYLTYSTEQYYQPYYCFYIQMGESKEYRRFFVPAVQGVSLDGEIPEPEVEILDISAYDYLDDFVYHKGDKCYTVENGQIVEIESPQMQSPYEIYGAVESELAEDGSWVTYFKYDGYKKTLNLTELTGNKDGVELNALYMDGKVIVICREERGPNSAYVTFYWYNEANQSLTKFADQVPGFVMGYTSFAYSFDYDRYAKWADGEENIVILDLVEGDIVETGIASKNVASIWNAGDDYYAVFYLNGQIAIVEKASGQKIKMSDYRFNVDPDRLMYKDGILYAEFMSEKLVYVVSKFEE